MINQDYQHLYRGCNKPLQTTNRLQSGYIRFFLFVMGSLICASATYAETEEIIQLDSTIGFNISAEENQQYNLFPEYDNFVSAEIIRVDDQYQLHVITSTDGKRSRQIQSLTEKELADLRQRITTESESGSSRTEAEKREGRLILNLNSLTYGLGLYGPGLVMALDLDDGADAGTVMLAGGGSYLTSLAVTRDFDLGYGRSKLLRWGAYAGTTYGFLSLSFLDSENERLAFVPSMLLTPVGAYTAYKLSDHRWFNKGEADLLAAGGLAGAFYGWAVPYLILNEDFGDEGEEYIDQEWVQICEEEKGNIDCPEGDLDCQRWNEERDCQEEAISYRGGTINKIYSFSMMASIPASVYLTSRLIPDRNISQGRAQLISTGGVVGAFYGLGIMFVALGDEIDSKGRAFAAAAMAGLPIGSYFAERFTRQESYTRLRALLITLGGVAGGYMGAGVLAIAEADNSRMVAATLIPATAAGFWAGHEMTRTKVVAGSTGLFNSERFSVQLASAGEIAAFGLSALRKSSPQHRADLKLNLLRGRF